MVWQTDAITIATAIAREAVPQAAQAAAAPVAPADVHQAVKEIAQADVQIRVRQTALISVRRAQDLIHSVNCSKRKAGKQDCFPVFCI